MQIEEQIKMEAERRTNYAIRQQWFKHGANFVLELMGWVKVGDRLPEKDGRYLCLCERQEYVLSYSFGRFYMDFHIKKYFEDWTHYVTHWTYLPPPKD